MENFLVLGLGASGVAVSNFLNKIEKNVFVYDDNKKKTQELIDGGILSKNCEVLSKLCAKTICIIHCIIISPGVVLSKKLKKLIKEFNIEVIGELAFASRYCEAPIYAITGTNGKTTTASLLNTIFNTAKMKTHLVGNIGNAFSGEVDKISPTDKVVCEVSSFQLEYSQDFSPFAVGFLNIAPDHLDRYKDFDEYFNAKKIILERVGEGKVFLNYDDELVRNLSKTVKNYEYFSLSKLPQNERGLYFEDNKIFQQTADGSKYIIDLQKNKLLGKHNLQNILCAVSLALYAGVTPEIIQKSVKNFQTPRHRIEYVGKINGALYYNDSKATNTNSTLTAVKCFEGKTIWLLLGGSNKGENFAPFFKELPNNIKHIITFGKMGRKLASLAKTTGFDSVHLCRDLYDAVMCARQHAKKDEVVLLSPACASFDEFNNYRERGEYFCNLVAENNEE